MDSSYKRKLYQWVFESFGDTADLGGTSLNVNNTTSSNNTPYAGSMKVGGTNMPVKNDIAGEDLKKKYGGVAKLKDLKQLTDNYLRDIKSALEDCLSENANESSYAKLLDLMQKPEIITNLEHLKEELSLAKQNQGLHMNGPVN